MITLVLYGLIAVTLIVGLWLVAKRVSPGRPVAKQLADDFDAYNPYGGPPSVDD